MQDFRLLAIFQIKVIPYTESNWTRKRYHPKLPNQSNKPTVRATAWSAKKKKKKKKRQNGDAFLKLENDYTKINYPGDKITVLLVAATLPKLHA